MAPEAEAQRPFRAPPDGPVIVVGTTDGAGDRLVDLLGRQPRLCRVPRSRLLVELVIAIARNQPALAVYGFSPEYWRRAVGAFFDGIQREFVTQAHKVRWVLYASTSTLSVEELGQLFPTAQFVHVITPPRGGAGRIVAANRRAGAGFPPGTYLEFAEAEMLTDPELCVSRVLRFLGEDDVSVTDAEVVLEPEITVDLEDATLRP